MDYFEFYGLREDPFRLTPDTEFFFPSDNHRLALDSLDYAVEHKEGFCLIAGEPGTGKTTALKVFVNKWKERAEIALILTPRLSPKEFLAAVLDELGSGRGGGKKIDLIKAFRDFLLEKSLSGRPVVIIVDEAQDLSDDTLEELRLLSNMETEKEKLLQIILVGQSALEKRLKSEALKQLDQRIAVRVRLRPLTPEELYRYLNHRLQRAGGGYLKTGRGVAAAIFRYSKGVPRMVNIIASRAVMVAYLERRNSIKPGHVRCAARHLEGGPSAKKGRAAGTGYAAVAAVILTLLAVLAVTSFRGGRPIAVFALDGVAAVREAAAIAIIKEPVAEKPAHPAFVSRPAAPEAYGAATPEEDPAVKSGQEPEAQAPEATGGPEK